MTSPNSHAPRVPEMESLADIRRQVYVNFRQVLERDKSVFKPVNKSRMKKLVKQTESMQPLQRRLGYEKLVEILRGMVDEGLFESELRAWREFPEFFPSKPLGDDNEKSTEADLVGGCEEVQKEGSGDVFTEDDLGDSPPSGVKDHAPTQDDKTLLAAESMMKNDIAINTAAGRTQGNALETLTGIDRYLPYSAQHAILIPVQRILEEACFGFAERYLPSALEGTRNDCPAAVELTKWVKILTKHRDNLGATIARSLKSPSFPDLMVSMQRLRHTAVHRIPLPTTVILRLVSSAADVAQMLRDDARAELIRVIHQNVETDYQKSNDVCQALREAAVRELQEVRRAREELDLREKSIMKKMLDEDAKHKRDLGRRLERAVGDVIAEWEGKATANLDLTEGPVQPEESDMKLANSEDEKVSLSNESVVDKSVGVGFSWSVL